MSGESITYTVKKDPYSKNVVCRNREESDWKLLCFKQDLTATKNFEPRNPKSITLGNHIEKSSHLINTEKTKTKSVSMKHTEGGWPESIKDYTESREINGWKRHKEKEDLEFPQKVNTLLTKTRLILEQNLRMDVYEEYFDESELTANEDIFSAKIKTVFKDTEKYKRSISKIEFSPDEEQSRIAVAYRLHKGQEIEPNYKFPCLVWDLYNPNIPEKILICTSEIRTLGFHPRHHNILGAGCANGTAVIFDLNTQKLLATTPSNEYTHSEAICDFVWLKSNKSVEFVTTSTDGKAIWWDVKGINSNPPVPVTIENEKPSLILLDKGSEVEKEYGGIRIEYNPEAGSTKFLFGTEQGIIFLANKKKNDSEITGFGLKSGRHLGPILGMKRCPAFLKFFLTVGDWTARIWAEDYKTPVMVSKFHPAYVTDCLWSVRVGLYFIARADGWINAYDLCYKINEFAFSYKVCDSAIISISLNNKGDKLVVGDEEGKVYLIKLSKSFYSQHDHENKKNYINLLFEREYQREKDLNKKKPVIVKDESAKLIKQEQVIKEKIRNINENYSTMLESILQVKTGKEYIIYYNPFRESKEVKEISNKKLDENVKINKEQIEKSNNSNSIKAEIPTTITKNETNERKSLVNSEPEKTKNANISINNESKVNKSIDNNNLNINKSNIESQPNESLIKGDQNESLLKLNDSVLNKSKEGKTTEALDDKYIPDELGDQESKEN